MISVMATGREIKDQDTSMKIRHAREILKTRPDDQQLKEKIAELNNKLNVVELQHYQHCVENYPTDVQAKHDYGVLLIRHKQYDKAIPLLQEAQKDPRRRIAAMDKIGLCFFERLVPRRHRRI